MTKKETFCLKATRFAIKITESSVINHLHNKKCSPASLHTQSDIMLYSVFADLLVHVEVDIQATQLISLFFNLQSLLI